MCPFGGGWRKVRVFHPDVSESHRYGESIALESGDRIHVAATNAARFEVRLGQFLPSVSGALGFTVLLLSVAAWA